MTLRGPIDPCLKCGRDRALVGKMHRCEPSALQRATDDFVAAVLDSVPTRPKVKTARKPKKRKAKTRPVAKRKVKR
jgi:hypothetical protein